jgi:hypothetical protein
MTGQLSRQSKEVISILRKEEVLQDVEGHRLDQSEGVILVTCADGDRYFDVFQNQVLMQASHRTDPRIHALSWHGGALACAPCSPINRRKHADLVFLDQVADARKLKNINLVALYAHAPCGAAGLCGLSLEETVALQVRAKKKIKTLNQGVQVGCFFHVDYGESKQRTYFLSRERWEKWAGMNHVQAIA